MNNYYLSKLAMSRYGTFSVFLTGTDGDSYIDFGTPNQAAMSDPSQMVYMDVLETPWWSQWLTGIRYTDGSIESVPSAIAHFYTGASCIMGPTDEITSLQESLVASAPSASPPAVLGPAGEPEAACWASARPCFRTGSVPPAPPGC